jgi:DNA invertase Pin-like site-specific DNA recombinase
MFRWWMPRNRPHMPTLYSYARVSSGRQVPGAGLLRQSQQAERWAAERGLPLSSFVDAGRSAYRGKHARRGPLSRFLAAAKEGRLGAGPVLLCEDFDRISRQEPLDALREIVLELVACGVSLVTLQDGAVYSRQTLREDSTKLLVLVLRVTAANDYSKRISARVSDAAARAKEAGRRSWGAPAWLTDPVQADAIRHMYDLHEQGLGSSAIARRLNDEGVPTPRGRSWSPASIKNAMSKPAVCGTLVRNDGSQVPDFYRPALVSVERWLAAQGRRQRTSFVLTGGQSWYLGQGISTCHHCQRSVGVNSSISSGVGRKRTRHLRCSTPGCSPKSWKVDDANRWLLERLTSRALHELRQGPAAAPPDLTAAQNAVDAAAARVAALDQALAEAAAEPGVLLGLGRALAAASLAREQASAELAAQMAVPTTAGPAPGPPVGLDNAGGRKAYSESLHRFGLRIVCDFRAGTWSFALPGQAAQWAQFGPTDLLDEFGPVWPAPAHHTEEMAERDWEAVQRRWREEAARG